MIAHNIKEGSSQLMKHQFQKMDILFYEAYTQLQSNFYKSMVYHLVKALLFIIFMPIDYTILNQEQSLLTAAMALAIAVSVFAAAADLLYARMAFSPRKAIGLAEAMHHSVDEMAENPDDIDQCVSPVIYNAENMTRADMEGLTPEIKRRYKAIHMFLVDNEVKRNHELLNSMQNFCKFLTFTSLVFSIVALAITPSSTPEKVVMIIYIVLEAVSKWVVVVAFIALALLPVICVVVCVYWCCCATAPEGMGEVTLPPVQKATTDLIIQSGGDCPICYQNFTPDEDVIVLNCNSKHVFHGFCLENWIKVKPNCPVCRAEIGNAD